MKILAFVLVFLSTPFLGYSQESGDLLKQANQFYYDNNLSKAKKLYHEILASKGPRGSVYYNLGHVYFRQNQLAKALLYYEKAQLRLPRNEDLAASLKFVREKIDPSGSLNQQKFSWQQLFFLNSTFILKELAWAFALLFSGFWVGLTVLLVLKKTPPRSLVIGFGVVLLFLATSVAVKYHNEIHQHWALVMEPQLEVRSHFLEKQKPLTILSQGLKVRVLSSQDFGDHETWFQIALPNGSQGWVNAGGLSSI